MIFAYGVKPRCNLCTDVTNIVFVGSKGTVPQALALKKTGANWTKPRGLEEDGSKLDKAVRLEEGNGHAGQSRAAATHSRASEYFQKASHDRSSGT